MSPEKLLVGLATGCSTLAAIACLVVVPSLYAAINDIYEEVRDGAEACI